MSRPRDIDPIENFIEQIGLMLQADGGPRIAGRIFGLLLVEGRAFSLGEMADRLKISKASASTNARLLARREVVRRTALPGDRQDYYELVPLPYHQMLETVSARMRRAAAKIEDAERPIPAEREEAKRRIRGLAEFYRNSADFMDAWIENLRASGTPPASG